MKFLNYMFPNTLVRLMGKTLSISSLSEILKESTHLNLLELNRILPSSYVDDIGD